MPTVQNGGLQTQVNDEDTNTLVENQIKAMRASLAGNENLEGTNNRYSESNEFVKKLVQINAEYVKFVNACDALNKAHGAHKNETNVNKRYKEFFPPTLTAYKNLDAQIKSQKSLNCINVPPLTQEFINSTPKDVLPGIQALHKQIMERKNFCETAYQLMRDTQSKLVAYYKDIALRQKQNAGIAPAPNGDAPKPPLSSMHGAQYANSKAQADAANAAKIGSQVQNQNPNAKAK